VSDPLAHFDRWARPLRAAASGAKARWLLLSRFGFEFLGAAVAHEPPVVWLVSWVAAVTSDGRSGDASGLRMPLPTTVASRLAAGDELGTIIDDLFGVTASKQHTGAVGLLTEGFVSRTDAFADLVAMACAPLLRPDLYPQGDD